MNQIVKFNPNSKLQPAHLAAIFGEESNVKSAFVTVPSLSPEGKVWTVSVNGEKTRITKTNDDGDVEPISTMRVVVLDYALRRGRAYYEGTYDPAKPAKPLCWSEDSIRPHASVEFKQHGVCEGCPMSIKTEGRPTPCQQHRMLAVVPSGDLTFTPLRLKLSITSVWDAKSPQLAAQGWYAWDNFKDYLIKQRGSPHTASFVTKMRFDPNVTYPKIMFAHERWLDDEELSAVQPIAKSDEVKALLAGTWTATGVDGEKIETIQPEVAPPVQAPLVVTGVTKEASFGRRKSPTAPAEKFVQPVLMDDDDDAPVTVEAPASKAPPVAAKAVPAKPAPAKPAPVAAQVISSVSDPAVEALLAKWDVEGDD